MSKKTDKTEKTDKPDQSDSPQSQAPQLAVQGGSVAKQSLLAAKELAAQVKTLDDGDDIEEHLRRLDDMAELMMVDDMVKYQAMLLSMNEAMRMEFTAWLKTENLLDGVRGKPESLKKRLLEKFRVRKSMLERINFIIQPRRVEQRLVVDFLERQRVYVEVYAELMKNREKLLVEAAMQLLSPEDRADYCNLRPDEAKRNMGDLIEFARRKEDERLQDEKVRKSMLERDDDDDDDDDSPAMLMWKRNDDDDDDDLKMMMKKKKTKKKIDNPGADDDWKMPYKKKKKSSTKKSLDEEEEEERERHLADGRCFFCHKIGHIAADCPKKLKNPKNDDTDVVAASSGKKPHRRGSDANSF